METFKLDDFEITINSHYGYQGNREMRETLEALWGFYCEDEDFKVTIENLITGHKEYKRGKKQIENMLNMIKKLSAKSTQKELRNTISFVYEGLKKI